MDLSQILNQGVPQFGMQPGSAQPQAMQGLGMAQAQQPLPDIQAPAPTSPQEVEQRKGMWAQVIQAIDQDPNLQRAMMIMGLNMMQPGATLGGSGLAGVAAYEEGKQNQLDLERQQRAEQREQERHDETIMTSREAREWNSKVKPLELKALQAEIDAIPDHAERRALDLELKRLERDMAPDMARAELARLRAQTAAAGRSGSARETDLFQVKEAMKAQLIGQGVDPLEAEAQAYEQALMLMRGLPTQMRGDQRLSEQEMNAVAAAQTFASLPEQMRPLYQTDPAFMTQVTLGTQILQRQAAERAAQQPQSAPAPQSEAPPQRRVISAADIRAGLQAETPAQPARHTVPAPLFSDALQDAKRGSMVGRQSLRDWLASGELSPEQRQQAEQALGR